MTKPGRPKILIVDDEAAIRDLLVEVLADEGYLVVAASNGRAAVAMVLREQPDLVLMDVMMPELDGPGTVRQLRALPESATVPIVLMSAAHHLAPDSADGVSFVSKPFDLEHLLAVVAQKLYPRRS